jgi:hypothetical protein
MPIIMGTNEGFGNPDNFMNSYFGPLGKEYCVYFYALSIIFGITFVLSAFSIASFVVMHHKKVDAMFVANSFLVLFNTFLAYLANRLLHTMCVKTI